MASASVLLLGAKQRGARQVYVGLTVVESNNGCTDAPLAHCLAYRHRFFCNRHGQSLHAVRRKSLAQGQLQNSAS
jgi:hypothetical protein